MYINPEILVGVAREQFLTDQRMHDEHRMMLIEQRAKVEALKIELINTQYELESMEKLVNATCTVVRSSRTRLNKLNTRYPWLFRHDPEITL